MQEITSLSEFEELKSSSLLIIDFYATWCGPCKFISPTFEKIAAEHASSTSIIFAKCDVDNASDVAEACHISAMPTFKFFRNGVNVDEVRGANLHKLNQKLDQFIADVAKEQEVKNNKSNLTSASASTPKPESLRDLIDANSSKLLGTSNLSSVQNIISPPPAGYAIASVAGSSQLLIHIVFSALVNLDSLLISMMKDSALSAPSRIEVGSNISVKIHTVNDEERNDLGMEMLKKAENLQSFSLFNDDYIDSTAVLKLKPSKFSKIKSLTIRFDSNFSGDSSVETKIGKIDILGVKI